MGAPSWSYSALKDFNNCPKKYNEVRRLKRFKDESFKQSEGLKVHDYFDAAFSKGQPIPQPYTHYNRFVEMFQNIKGVKMPEYEMAFTEKMEPRGWFDKDVWLRSAADLLIVRDDHHVAFSVDWKTGKSKYADTQQLKLTALCVWRLYPHVTEVRGGLLFPHEEKFIPATYQREQSPTYWQDFMTDYARLVNAVNKNDFPAKSSGLCKTCPVTSCEFNRKE